MKSSIHNKIRLAAVLALAAAPGLATAANVGYYDTCTGSGAAGQATAITAAGHTPVNVATPNSAGLATLDVFFVQNCSNTDLGAEYIANFADITNAVAGGLVLVVHDRWVTGGGTMVPGSGGITFTRDANSIIDIPLGSPITTGIGGTITNTTLDGGNSSNHGYVVTSTLPAGATVLLTRTLTTEGVTVAYGHGSGRVIYSTVPLDFYLAGNGSVAAFRTIYAPNIIEYAAGPAFVSCLAEGFKSDKLKLCQMICEIPQTPAVRAELTRLWVIKTGTPRPCP